MKTLIHLTKPWSKPASLGGLALGLITFGVQSERSFAQSISPTNADFLTAGGSGSITVTATGTWTAASDDDWVQITSPAPGTTNTGNGMVQYSVSALADNTTDINRYMRLGTLTVAGQNFTVTQHRSGQVSYDAWAVALPAGTNGPGQDASGTGIPNFVKYALGLDPLNPDPAGMPNLTVSNGVAAYFLTKPGSVVGVRYNVKRTDNLTSPPTNTLALTKASGANPTEIWQATMPADGVSEFVASSAVPVGVTAREVQKTLLTTFSNFTTNLTLWNIQPGLGTVMIEYGRRIAMMKKAVEAGDWGMAQYQLQEATEIQEVGEITRAGNAARLKNFEQNFLDPMVQDILAKDTNSFATHFSQALDGCNACHAVTGHSYITFQPPTDSPQAFLDLAANNPVTPTTNAPPAPIAPASDSPLTWSETWQQISDPFNTVDRRLPLWNIQPGLGTVMMEYGRRFALMKLAVDAADWGMAQYQLQEATEIQEVGEVTRPNNAARLKNFEHNFLDPLMQDILAKDTNSFATHFSQALDGCNACHAVTGHPYVTMQTAPLSPEPFLLLAASDPTTPGTNAPFTPYTPTFGSEGPSFADAQNLVSNRFNNLDRNLALWNIQPGLGTVMMEYGYRFALAWYAAEATNWDMAAYQIKEATEIQEVGETTRPSNAARLKNFEQTFLDPINVAIAAKDKAGFESAYNSAIDGCNACHAVTGHAYVRVQVSPVTPADYLKLAP